MRKGPFAAENARHGVGAHFHSSRLGDIVRFFGRQGKILSAMLERGRKTSTVLGAVSVKSEVLLYPPGELSSVRGKATDELIQKARARGADAVVNIAMDVKRSLNAKTNIETVTVELTGLAVKINTSWYPD
ncbi:MAG: YbjQ family protein [Treponema sp.]|jgi:hypothetical protein|nr:YbjQ family protein [Treponema sp.]